jgi:hypothetical protein
VTDMATETTPIYDILISELGNPVPAKPADRSYAALVKLAGVAEKAEEKVAEPVSLPSPASAKRPVKPGAQKPFAVVGRDKAS